MNHVLMFTPGLDSFMSNQILEKNGVDFKRVYCYLNSRYSENEWQFLNIMYSGIDDYVEKITGLDIASIEQESAYVPNRNLLLLTLVQAKTNADIIYISGVKDDRVSDNNEEFYKLASDVLSKCASKEVKIESLLSAREKTEWVSILKSKDPTEYLSQTYSCFDLEWNDALVDVYETTGDTYKVIDNIPVFGCLKCTACYRRLCAMTGTNAYVGFKDLDMVINYPDLIDIAKHPNRYTSAIQYVKFHKWLMLNKKI